MTTSRRDFLKTAGVAAGALSLSSLPSWINDVTAAEEAAANGINKNALAVFSFQIRAVFEQANVRTVE